MHWVYLCIIICHFHYCVHCEYRKVLFCTQLQKLFFFKRIILVEFMITNNFGQMIHSHDGAELMHLFLLLLFSRVAFFRIGDQADAILSHCFHVISKQYFIP